MKVKDTILLMVGSALAASVATLVIMGSKIIKVSKKLV